MESPWDDSVSSEVYNSCLQSWWSLQTKTIPQKPVSSSSKSQKPKEVSLKQNIRARCSNHKLSARNLWLKWDSCHLVLVTYLSSCFFDWFCWSLNHEVNITIHLWIRYLFCFCLSWFKRNLTGCGSKKTPFRDCQQRSRKKTINEKSWGKNTLSRELTILNYMSSPFPRTQPFSNHQLPAVATKLVKLRLGLRSIGVSSTIPLANLSSGVSEVKGSAKNRKLPPRFHGKNWETCGFEIVVLRKNNGFLVPLARSSWGLWCNLAG